MTIFCLASLCLPIIPFSIWPCSRAGEKPYWNTEMFVFLLCSKLSNGLCICCRVKARVLALAFQAAHSPSFGLSDAPPPPLSPVSSLLQPRALCFDPSSQALCITVFCPCLLFFIALFTYLHRIIFNLSRPVEESFHEAGDFVVVITCF